MMATLHDLHFELLPYPQCSPNLAPNDCYPFANLKKTLIENRYGSSDGDASLARYAFFENVVVNASIRFYLFWKIGPISYFDVEYFF